MYIENIPNELLEHIILSLDVDTILYTLNSLSRVNVLFKNIIKNMNKLIINKINRCPFEPMHLPENNNLKYHFVGYKIRYKYIHKLIKKYDIYKYDLKELNKIMYNKHSLQIIEDTSDMPIYYMGFVIKVCCLTTQIFVSLTNTYYINQEKHYIRKCILNGIYKLLFSKHKYKIYCNRYNIDTLTNGYKKLPEKDFILLYYMYYVLYKKHKLYTFLDMFELTIDDIINCIYIDCNVRTYNYLKNIKNITKTKSNKIYHQIINSQEY